MSSTFSSAAVSAPDQESGMKVNVKPAKQGGNGAMLGAGVAIGLCCGIGAGVGIGAGAFSGSKDSSSMGAFLSADGAVRTPSAMIATTGNVCMGKKPTGDAWKNFDCIKDDIVKAAEQAGADVTVGYVGNLSTTAVPITTPYYQNGMCPVNVHWHLGAEHRSAGEYDETIGKGPTTDEELQKKRRLAGKVRLGLRCGKYDAADAKFTTAYDWKHCVGMHVGETYEVHWPHSKAGACGTIDQWQTPFYDGVFCSDTAVGLVLDGTIPVNEAVGVQAQVFTIVNDESYYYPDLMRGMIVEDHFGKDIAAYTGSTTGTSRDNTVCSAFAPITWQVDRKCHLISASTFDKMCADMKMQRDDMRDDLHAHGSRELVLSKFTANNQGANVANPLFRE